MKISTLALSSCCGCHMALVNLGSRLVNLLANEEVVYSPVLMDSKDIVPCDVALIEGSIRSDEDRAKLKELRASSTTLVALGTCATFGGIPGLGSAFSTLDLISKAYGANFDPEDLPVLEPRVAPIDQGVEVDYYLPGCPPPRDLIQSTLTSLLNRQEPVRADLPVCADCKRKVTQETQREIKRWVDHTPEKEHCFLSQGYLCLGSVTRSGCQATCTRAGVPCMGCRGPVDRVLSEPTHGILFDLTRRISHYTGKSAHQVQEQMPDMLHTLYAFALSVPELRRKDAEAVARLIHRVKF